MIDINKLVEKEAHGEIATISEPEYTKYKAVGLIHLSRYKEALQYLDSRSFEAAYCHYKMKNFKKAVKILKKHEDLKSKVLLSQALYFAGYYNTAYQLLSQVGIDDEIAVNLQAMQSLAILANKCATETPSRYSIREKDELLKFDNLDAYKFSDLEANAEYEYNKSFQYLNCEDIYKKHLESLLKSNDRLQNSIISLQYSNITGAFDDIDEGRLLKNQKKVLEFNKGKEAVFGDTYHFQGQENDKKSDYYWYRKCQELNYDIDFNLIPALSPNLRLLRSFVAIKNGRKNRRSIERNLKCVPDCNVKRLLLMIVSDSYNFDNINQDVKSL